MPATTRIRRSVSAFPRVSIGADNRVVYRAAAGPDRGRLGRSVALEGAWRLTRAHQLAFRVKQTGEAPPEHAFLKASLAGAGSNALDAAWEDDRAGSGRRRQFRLSGRWEADALNRLSFLVERGQGGEDRLVFGGGWEVGPHHELQYRYRRTGSARREQTLAFEGAWDVTGRDRLVYRVSGASKSVFEFRAGLQSPSLFAREGALVYQIGIGAGLGRVRRRVTLFGRWKLNRDLSVAFEIPYARGRVEAIRFEGTWVFGPRDQVQVALAGRDGRALGVSVTFSREVAPDRHLFLQLRRQAEERAVVGGVTVRF